MSKVTNMPSMNVLRNILAGSESIQSVFKVSQVWFQYLLGDSLYSGSELFYLVIIILEDDLHYSEASLLFRQVLGTSFGMVRLLPVLQGQFYTILCTSIAL
ncbi:uncharacterized protein BJ212DRAFT_1303731 [Suillus subaureus]|uniref:Uncharacterized protein n=1 Tax=Suillus subaureus TaxID=48587 RepID=A0A9P7DXZ2_9AGAM|nr:uncharacterized protein BJ212DRAFT_1303731 [Suillus subaureus]KAG1806217.1 hypothetical protein BJ212DRAFT_1303731 [Suillus subaureus]